MEERSQIVKGWEDQKAPDSNESSAITVTPEEPFKIIRDRTTGVPMMIVYGDTNRLNNGEAVVTWSEEFERDPITNKVIAIITSRPNGVMTREAFTYDADGRVSGSELKFL